MPDDTPRKLTTRQAEKLARVLASTRQELSKRSAEQLRMEDIAAASGVAAGTLYNRFGSKEGLIGMALLDYFDEAVGDLVASHRSGTPVEILVYGLRVTARAGLSAPNFTRALMTTYFRPGTEHVASNRLTQRVFETWLPLFQSMRDRDGLADWVNIELLDMEICERLFGVVVKWAQGKIPDRELPRRILLAILLILRGASVGAQAAEIDPMLARLNRMRRR